MKNKVGHIAITLLFSIISTVVSAVCISNFQFHETSPLDVQFENMATSTGEGNVHYYWDFGDGNTSYEENPFHHYESPGIYEVSLTLITTNLCFDTKSRDIYIGIPPTSPSCVLEIDFQTENATAPDYNNGSATVFGFSDVPCCYYAFWSNGEEGETIENLAPGTYCVTLTNGESCYGTNCVTIGYNNNCVASYLIDSTTFSHLDGAYRFINNSHGEQNYFYWDFGDGITSNAYNPLHVYADTGTYNVCLTIYTHYGCTSSVCKTLQVDYISPLTANLYGIVKAGETLLPRGVAILYEYVNNKYTAKKFDVFENGNYQFDSLPKEIFYLTQIIPYFDLSEVYFPKYTATYFDNTEFWQASNLINLFADTIYTTQLYSYNDIYLNNGVISGAITYEDTESYEEDIFRQDWFGSSNFNDGFAGNLIVLLKNQNREVLDFRLTNGNGEYTFTNLEYGAYYLSVEKPGLISDELYIEISEGFYEIPQNDFMIQQNTASPVKQISESKFNSIFPNPATDKISLYSSEDSSVVRFYSVYGELIMEFFATFGTNEININTLPAGIYFVEINNGNKIFTQKLIKQ